MHSVCEVSLYNNNSLKSDFFVSGIEYFSCGNISLEFGIKDIPCPSYQTSKSTLTYSLKNNITGEKNPK